MAVLQKNNNDEGFSVFDFRNSLLNWYDEQRRDLPWRFAQKDKPNAYVVWLSEIMLQQTTVQTVGPYFLKFLEKWPTVHSLAMADRKDVLSEWAGLGYYARARNLHKCAQVIVQDYDGIFPSNKQELEKLPGIGDYTSSAIVAIAFNKPSTVVDGNVERIMSRVFLVSKPLPSSKKVLKSWADKLSNEQTIRPGDYAQALMDLGSMVCTPNSPKCLICPINCYCKAYKDGNPEKFPFKTKKVIKPQKHGVVYWIENRTKAVLFERRNDQSMLGGMMGLPTSEWVAQDEPYTDLFNICEQERKISQGQSHLKIKHSFTHFDLELNIQHISVYKNDIFTSDSYEWVDFAKIEKLGLPTLFKKVVKLMM